MSHRAGKSQPSGLSCRAKLARVVLEHRGPLAPSELAAEARIDPDSAEAALIELERQQVAERVCSVCESREELFALTGPRT